jgi:hypothetical protein
MNDPYDQTWTFPIPPPHASYYLYVNNIPRSFHKQNQ